jgi:hypothetical protein
MLVARAFAPDDDSKKSHLDRGCGRGMSVTGFQLACLLDSRLAPLATSALPAWLWSKDATRIVWANPVGAAMLGDATSGAISERTFDTRHSAAAEIGCLATTLKPGAPPRLERLRGFGAGVGRALTCACSLIQLADNAPVVLIAAAERAGPNLSLDERVHRLLAGSSDPVAAFSPDGKLLHATPSAQTHLRGATSLAAIGGGALVTEALESGHAVGGLESAPEGRIEALIDRIGDKGTAVLIARLSEPPVAAEPRQQWRHKRLQTCHPMATVVAPTSPPAVGRFVSPEVPSERRHPLRFPADG